MEKKNEHWDIIKSNSKPQRSLISLLFIYVYILLPHKLLLQFYLCMNKWEEYTHANEQYMREKSERQAAQSVC